MFLILVFWSKVQKFLCLMNELNNIYYLLSLPMIGCRI